MTIPSLRFRRAGYPIALEFSAEVLEHFDRHRQVKWMSCEAGGQLFSTLAEPGIVRVTDATGPRPTDRRSPYGYKPDRHAEREEIIERYGHGLHFIGDWHTHRQRLPEPSGRDKRSMRDMVRRSSVEPPGCFLIIVGQMKFPDGLHVSLYPNDDATELVFLVDESATT